MKCNFMSIVLQPNPNCTERKQQLYSDLEILSKYTAQTCNSTKTKQKKLVQSVGLLFGLQAVQHHNEQIFGAK